MANNMRVSTGGTSKLDTIKAFVNDLSRNCYFDYDHNSDDYPGLDNYYFKI